MNRKQLLLAGSLVAALSTGTSAFASGSTGTRDNGYCTIPLLYAMNVRTTCEQYGTNGLAALFTGSRMFEQMLHRPQMPGVSPKPDTSHSHS